VGNGPNLGRPGREHAVLVRQLPAGRRMADLVATGADLRQEVRQVAERVAALHATSPRSSTIDRAGLSEVVRARWEAHLTALTALTALANGSGRQLDTLLLARIQDRAHRYLIGRIPLLDQRIRCGAIVDGHGQLCAANISCLPDGPRILDRADGDAARHGDVLTDIGYLAMDLERLGAPAYAAALLDDYRHATGIDHPASLAHWYVAERAIGRAAAVAERATRAGTPEADAGTREAQRLLRLADRQLATGRVRLVLVGGLPGTGKSTVAEALAGRLGWPVIRGDLIRAQFAGPAARPTGRPGRDRVRPEWTGATYSTMLDHAGELLCLGRSVLLDATWAEPMHRAAAARLARRSAADLVVLQCHATADRALARIAGRPPGGRTAVDPYAEIEAYYQLAGHAEEWPGATRLDTGRPLPETLAAALRAVDRIRVPADAAAG
jgi:aminoglycoside phosphotransferase family enzyme/predicted kinase